MSIFKRNNAANPQILVEQPLSALNHASTIHAATPIRKAAVPLVIRSIGGDISNLWNSGVDIVSTGLSKLISSGSASATGYTKRQLRAHRQAARALFRTNPIVSSYVSIVQSNVVGPSGIQLACGVRDASGVALDKVNTDVEALWSKFCKSVSVDGKHGLIDFLNLIQSTELIDGEYFVRTVYNPTLPLGVGFELIPTELVDELLNTGMQKDGSCIRLGIRYDTLNRPVSYFIRTPLLGEPVLAQVAKLKSVGGHYELPASEILHNYNAGEVGVGRGMTTLATVLTALEQFSAYQKAVIASEQIAASKVGFVSRKNPDAEELETNPTIDATPGSFVELPENYELHSWTPSGSGALFGDVTKTLLRIIASGLRMSYNALANDLQSTSYSSIRSGMLQERTTFKTIQARRVADCRALFAVVVAYAIETKALALPPSVSLAQLLDSVNFVPKGFDWIDPEKDAKAVVLQVNNGLASKSQLLQEKGSDYETILAQIQRDRELEAKYGFSAVATPEPAPVLQAPSDSSNP